MDEKYKAYKKLMHYRTFLPFYIAIPSIILVNIFQSFNLPEWIVGIITLIFAYVAMFWFLAKNNCPWCGEPFFDLGFGFMNGLSFFSQTQCQHCHSPQSQ